MNKIFDPFFTTKNVGTGLGLTVSHKIIQDHGGMIEVESQINKGTTFSITLPINNNQ
jgi:signal transduction histidine kinase